VDPILLPAFRFEISLIRSVEIVAGTQSLEGTAAPAGGVPAGAKVLGNGGFQECTGLEIEMDIQDYLEGGRNNGVVRRAGRAKFQPIVLKRGMFFDASTDGSSASDNRCNTELWSWMQDVINGVRPIARYDGIVYVKSQDNAVRATWVFERGLPAKIKGPELNGKTGEIAIEELAIAHEGLRLLAAGGGA
jgi:phage tail-like protein